jgi:hypothetical protein
MAHLSGAGEITKQILRKAWGKTEKTGFCVKSWRKTKNM